MRSTKNSVKAKLQIMINLCNEAKKLGDEICDMFEANDTIFDLLNQIQNCEITEIDDIMSELEQYHCFEESNITENGDSIYVPSVRYNNELALEVLKPCNGGVLVAYVNESDFNSSQAGVCWMKDADDLAYQFDLCMAEVLDGDLAVVSDKQPDNKDVDIMVWGNIFREDYTYKTTIPHQSIEEILKEDE